MKDSSVIVTRHRHRRRNRKNAGAKFLVVFLFAATAAITWQFARQKPVSSMAYSSAEANEIKLSETDASSASASYSSFVRSRPGRPAYLYSVIPGGVASPQELRQAMDHDPVVAQQFAGFDFQRAHLIQVSDSQPMHVAYRTGDKVYWTRKKVALHKGETLISDGKITARTRCGNRIALVPLGPPAFAEPTLADLDQPLFSNDMVTPEVEPQPETYADAIPMAAPTGADALQPAKRKFITPFLLLPVFGLAGTSSGGSSVGTGGGGGGGGTGGGGGGGTGGGGGGGGAGGGGGGGTGGGGGGGTGGGGGGGTGGGGFSTPPIAVTPEPGTMLLFSSGLLGVLWKVRKSGRKQ